MHIIIINKQQNKNKNERISTIIDEVNNGRIIFCAERVMSEALSELMGFSGQETTLHDDFADSVASFSHLIDEIKIIRPINITPNWFR